MFCITLSLQLQVILQYDSESIFYTNAPLSMPWVHKALLEELKTALARRKSEMCSDDVQQIDIVVAVPESTFGTTHGTNSTKWELKF